MQKTHQSRLSEAIDILRGCRLALSNCAFDPGTLLSLDEAICLIEGAAEAIDQDERRTRILEAITKLSDVFVKGAAFFELIKRICG